MLAEVFSVGDNDEIRYRAAIRHFLTNGPPKKAKYVSLVHVSSVVAFRHNNIVGRRAWTSDGLMMNYNMATNSIYEVHYLLCLNRNETVVK